MNQNFGLNNSPDIISIIIVLSWIFLFLLKFYY